MSESIDISDEPVNWPELLKNMDQAALRRPRLDRKVGIAHAALSKAQSSMLETKNERRNNRVVGRGEFRATLRDHEIILTRGTSVVESDDSRSCFLGSMQFTDRAVDLSGTTGVVINGGVLQQKIGHSGYILSVMITDAPDQTLIGRFFGIRAIDCTFIVGKSIHEE